MKKSKNKPKPVECPNNEGVACPRPNECAGCGWNPKMEEIRNRRIRKNG